MAIQVIPVVAAFIRKDKRFLLAQRLPDRNEPLRWEFPGGKLEAGESPEEALKREIREELGMDIIAGRVLDVRINGSYMILFYECEALNEEMICKECTDARFVTYDEALRIDMIPQDREALIRITSR